MKIKFNSLRSPIEQLNEQDRIVIKQGSSKLLSEIEEEDRTFFTYLFGQKVVVTDCYTTIPKVAVRHQNGMTRFLISENWIDKRYGIERVKR